MGIMRDDDQDDDDTGEGFVGNHSRIVRILDCAMCDDTFEYNGRGVFPSFCSVDCKKMARRYDELGVPRRSPPMKNLKCEVCQKTFVWLFMAHQGPQPLTCSDRCRGERMRLNSKARYASIRAERAPVVIRCQACGKDVEHNGKPGRPPLHCSQICKARDQARRLLEKAQAQAQEAEAVFRQNQDEELRAATQKSEDA